METILTDIKQLGPVPALLLFLNVIGLLVKKSALDTRWNVWILPVLGAIIWPFLTDATAPVVSDEVTWSPYVRYHAMNAIYGFCIGWAAVGANQALRLFGGGQEPPASQPPQP